MPTQDPKAALTLEEARERVAAQSFARDVEKDESGSCGHERIGLEPEYIVVNVDAAGTPVGRPPLFGEGSVTQALDEVARDADWLAPRDPQAGAPAYLISNEGRITFEPGGQVEHSTVPHDTAAQALEDVEQVELRLAETFGRRGARLASLGVDLWWSPDDVPQQLRAPRYPAMAALFEKHGPHGRTMMRSTGSCQLNLDLCHGSALRERWAITNLLSPLLTATFASSPGDGVQSRRAQAWQRLDPSRTGFPDSVVSGCEREPWVGYAQAAMDADVMVFPRPDGTVEAGTPGFTFADWVRAGHPEHGWPTLADIDYHLTTLFFEVRPRRFFEMRAADALPRRWRPVPVVLGTGLVYCDRARGQGLERLESIRARLPRVWETAAEGGLHDAELGQLAKDVWPVALEGARRMPEGYFRPSDLACTEQFLERFTFRGLAPADELREEHAAGGSRSLAWAAREVELAGPEGSRRARA